MDDELELEAVDLSGTVFDAMNIRRTPRPRQLYQATWHTADLRRANVADGDGHFVDQRFELVGRGLAGLPGAFSNPGRLFVNNDRTNLYLGLDRLMAYSSNSVLLFVESPRSSGVSRLDGLGNGILDPEREGADGLDFLHNLSFTNFSPTLGCILGDEFGDGQAPSFMPTGMVFNTGQGIYRLAPGFPDVPGSELQQFNRSPQTTPVFGEASADFVEMTIPLAELGGTRAGDVIKLGVVIAGAGVNTNAAVQSRDLDFSFIGYALHGSGFSNVVLEGLAVQLAVDPDPDSDGLTTAEEEALGTNPANGDSDGDGLPDGWEVRHGLNPLDAGGGHGGGGDLDSDGLSNYGEYLAGTDPQDATSALSMRVSFSGTNMLRLSWQAVPGKKYQIEVSESAAGIFAPLPAANSPRVAQSSEENVVESLASGSGSRFYRVRLVP